MFKFTFVSCGASVGHDGGEDGDADIDGSGHMRVEKMEMLILTEAGT